MGGYLRALAIVLAVHVLNRLFLGLAGLLQLRTWSVSWSEATRTAAQAPLNVALVQAAGIGIIFILAFPHKRRESGLLESVHVQPLLGGIVALCFVAGACMALPLNEVGNFVQEVWPMSFDQLARLHRLINPSTWWGGFSALFALVLVAPVTEEILFRGWLLHDLEREYGQAPALLWSSALFGLAHVVLPAIVPAALGGLVLGAVALRTKSILASIAMHAGVNALPLLLPANLIRIEGFNTLSQHVEHVSWWLVLASSVAAATALWIIWRSSANEG
jgi:membrane protease YdiL (CAAX protease family)